MMNCFKMRTVRDINETILRNNDLFKMRTVRGINRKHLEKWRIYSKFVLVGIYVENPFRNDDLI